MHLPLSELLKMRTLNKSLSTVVRAEMMRRASVNTVDDVVTIAHLLDYCYQEQTLRYVVHKEKSYYPCNSSWYTRKNDVPVQEHDPNIACYGYEECHFRGEWKRIQSLDESPHCVYPDDNDVIKYVFVENVSARINVKGGNLALGSLLYFPRPMLLVNNMGKNDDHRGSNHINIELDFEDSYLISSGIHTLYHVLQACYRIKHHKFYHGYEAFLTFIFDDDIVDARKMAELEESIRINNSGWMVYPVIDHGS